MKSFLPAWVRRLFVDTTTKVEELKQTLNEAKQLREQATAYLDGEDDWWKKTDADRNACGVDERD